MIALLLALYPAPWRRRYGEEFRAVLESRPLGPFDAADVLLGALDARLTRFRLVGAAEPGGGHRQMLRIGGLAAIGGGILWFAGFAGMSGAFEPPIFWLVTLLLGTLGILVALVGLSAFQAHRDPKLAWAAFGIPALGTLASIVGLVAWTLVPSDWPIVAGLNAWSIWALGSMTTLIGSILFAISTRRAAVLSPRAATSLAVSALMILVLATGMSGIDGPTTLTRTVTAIGLASFAASWVALGLAALRRGPIRAVAAA